MLSRYNYMQIIHSYKHTQNEIETDEARWWKYGRGKYDLNNKGVPRH